MLLKKFVILLFFALILSFLIYIFNKRSIDEKSVMITQIVEHPALNSVRDGVIAALTDHGFKSHVALKLIEENAHGNISTAAQIAQKFVGSHPSLIIAISTPSAQAVVNAARGKNDIPIVFAAVTDPVAANIVNPADTAKNRVTGVLDRAPFEKQLKLIKTLMGSNKRLGFIYNVGEVNSIVALDIFREQAKIMDLQIIVASTANSSEVGAIVHGIIDKVDAIYIPNDNTIVSAINSVVKISSDARKPVFAADIMLVERGIVATVGVNYAHIGYLTGEMAAKILHGTSVQSIPVVIPQDHLLYVNASQARKIGLDLPKGMLEKADKVF